MGFTQAYPNKSDWYKQVEGKGVAISFVGIHIDTQEGIPMLPAEKLSPVGPEPVPFCELIGSERSQASKVILWGFIAY